MCFISLFLSSCFNSSSHIKGSICFEFVCLFACVGMSCLHECLLTTCMSCAHWGRKRELDSLNLELQAVVSHHVGARNQNWVFWKTGHYFSLSHYSSPHHMIFHVFLSFDNSYIYKIYSDYFHTLPPLLLSFTPAKPVLMSNPHPVSCLFFCLVLFV